MDSPTEREIALCNACVDYAENHAQAGLPGHNLMILIKKLMDTQATEAYKAQEKYFALEDKYNQYEKHLLTQNVTINQLTEQIEDLKWQLEQAND